MIDFKLTKDGDIDTGNAYQYPCFLIQFLIPTGKEIKKNNVGQIIRRHNAFRIDFDTDVKQYKTHDSGIMIQFETEKEYVPFHASNTKSVREKEELAQEIQIRLQTEKGEFEFLPLFGSELAYIRHEDIKADLTHETAAQYVQDAIGDIETENPYEISIEWIENHGDRYRYERLKATIDTEQDTIYEADIS